MNFLRSGSTRWFVFATVLAFGTPLGAAPVDSVEPKPLALEPPPKTTEPATPQPAPTELPSESQIDAVAEVTAAGEALLAGDMRDCENQLRAAYVKSPHLPPPKLMLAQLLIALNDVARARQTLEDYAVVDPSHPMVYLLFGTAALRQGHVTDASLHFEKALALPVPKSWSLQQLLMLKRQCFAGQIEVAERRRDWSEQREVLTRWIEIDRTDANLHDRLAMAHYHDGQPTLAFDEFDLAHRFDNQQNHAEVSMGVMASQAGRIDESQHWFARALERYPKDAAVPWEWSAVLLVQGRLDEAKSNAAAAAKLGNSSLELDFHRGVIAQHLGEFSEAEKFFQRVARESPQHPEARHQLALVLVDQKANSKREEARRLVEQLLQEQPQSPWALTVAGAVLYRLGDLDGAKKYLQTAESLGANWPETIYFSARVRRERGTPEEALASVTKLQQRLAAAGAFPLRAEAQGWLKSIAAEH